ncbi:hypothetical protein EYF80_036135 [Liparis tanakae]|uniref:Uncharacterized protein n=1 Tax=Liparis tanakae TaxID=230148 RepID=A0A4Z2GK52_9TELE|nr:hypothetical protein EYF80_036135 [Liparis tanakae]
MLDHITSPPRLPHQATVPDIRKGMRIFSPVSGWMMACKNTTRSSSPEAVQQLHRLLQPFLIRPNRYKLKSEQLPHMSTPHHIPGATAAITVTKEPANSFITQSTRALMTPRAK